MVQLMQVKASNINLRTKQISPINFCSPSVNRRQPGDKIFDAIEVCRHYTSYQNEDFQGLISHTLTTIEGLVLRAKGIYNGS